MWGRPLEGAEVWLVNRTQRARSDKDGRFELPMSPLGYQWARAKLRGFHRGSSRALITHDAPAQFVTMTLLPAADQTVRVVDEDGAPIAGAEVMFSRTASVGHVWLEQGERHVTDAQGRVIFADLALGNTAVHAVAPGFGVGEVNCYVGDSSEAVIKLTRTEAFRLRLQLTGATAEQIAAARWSLSSTRDGYGAGCTLPPSLTGGALDPDGTATIRGLPLDMELTQISIWLPDAGVSPRAENLPTARSQHRLDHQLTFAVVPRDEQPVSGTVVDDAGRPIAGLALTCNQYEFVKGRGLVRTDENGRFRFERVVAVGSTFSLQSRDARWVIDQAKTNALNAIRFRGRHESKLTPDAHHEVRCIPATELRGRVLDAAGHGVPGVDIELTTDWTADRTIGLLWATSDRDGMFVLPGLNGADRREVWIEARGNRGSTTGARVRLEVGAMTRLPDLTLTPPGAVAGTVRNAKAQPLAGVTLILLRADDHGEAAVAISDRDGRFRLAAGPGTYRITSFAGHQKDAKDQQEVEIRSGATTELALRCERR